MHTISSLSLGNKVVIFIGFLVLCFFIFIFLRLRAEKKTLEIGNTTRTYFEYRPTINAKGKLPVVIMLHGYKDNPRLMELYSGMDIQAAKEKFIVIYPEGIQGNSMWRSWNAQFCCGDARDTHSNDIHFIVGLIDTIRKRSYVDPHRIYIAGFSNGGMFTHSLAHAVEGKVAGLAVISGAIGNKAYTVPAPGTPLPIIMFHGTDDTTVPINGTSSSGGYSYKSLDEAEAFWVANNMCNIEANIEDVDRYTSHTYQCTYPVVTYAVKNRGHLWFGGLAEFLQGNIGSNFSVNDTMWNFFKDKTLQP